jgi:hypothetical protein
VLELARISQLASYEWHRGEHIHYNDFQKGGGAVSPEQLATWVHLAALELAQGKSAAQLAVLGGIFTQLGDTLAVMSAQKTLCESNENL